MEGGALQDVVTDDARLRGMSWLSTTTRTAPTRPVTFLIITSRRRPH